MPGLVAWDIRGTVWSVERLGSITAGRRTTRGCQLAVCKTVELDGVHATSRPHEH